MSANCPKTCGECRFFGCYDDGPYARNPHYCCELIWTLREEDYQVDPDTLDEECPLGDIDPESIDLDEEE